MTDSIDPIVATKSEWRDIGGDSSIRELRNKDGILLAIHWRHGTGHCAEADNNFVSTTNYMGDGWTIVSEDPLTLSPSLLCTICKTHGYIRNGRWDPC